MQKTVNRLSRQLVRAMERGKKNLVYTTYAPNRYQVRFARDDYASLDPIIDVLKSQLRTFLEETAAARQYKLLGGKIELSFKVDETVPAGRVEIKASFAEPRETEAADQETLRETLVSLPGSPVLVLRDGSMAARIFPLNKERHTLGRNGTDIELEDPLRRVSRVHAEITQRDGGYVLRDLDSANGSFINGERVSERKLEHKDMICLGGVELEFLQRARADRVDENGQRRPNGCRETQGRNELKCN